MRVALTGATGYVGSFTTKALVAAGHSPRLLARDQAKLTAKLSALDVHMGSVDVVIGDMTDAASAEHLVDGCDAVIHAAAAVAVLNRAEADRAYEINVTGTRNVLDAALDAHCDPVVHVSSVAVFGHDGPAVISADDPLSTGGDNPYGRSKAVADDYARSLQADGKPVVIVYPGGVTGPSAGDSYGEVAHGFVSMLKSGCLVTNAGGIDVIDVRDLAAVLTATISPGRGPRRYTAGGRLVTLPELGALIRRLTGRRFPVLPIPGAVFRGLGRVTDGVRGVVPFDTVFTAEAMQALTLVRATNDSAVARDLNVSYRDAEQTVAASLRALYEGGLLSPRQVGAIATTGQRPTGTGSAASG
jgi:nucleoside-diphosphate-sugar epimerase